MASKAAQLPTKLPKSGGSGKTRNYLGGLAGFVWLAIIIIPVYYVVITSFKNQAGFFADNPLAPPSNIEIKNYATVWENNFPQYFLNSVLVTAGAVTITVFLSLLAAYAISRSGTRLVRGVFNVFLLGLAIPMQATIIPVYMIIVEIGLYDTLWGVILPAAAFQIPITVLILVNFVRDIPGSLFESMKLDGASHMAIFFKLVVPLARPAIVTVMIYDAVNVWNGFLFPLILTQSQETRVLPLSLWSYQGEFAANIPAVLAAVVLSTLPLFVVYIIFRRQLVAGMTAGFSK